MPYLRFFINKFKGVKASEKSEEIERVERDTNIVVPRLTDAIRIVADVDTW